MNTLFKITSAIIERGARKKPDSLVRILIRPLEAAAILLFFGVVVLPFLIVFVVVHVISSVYQTISGKEKTKDVQPQVRWAIFTKHNDVSFYSNVAGDVRDGEEFLFLRADPVVPALQDHIYGDWFYQINKGIFLQQWNSTDNASANLVFVNTTSLEVHTILENIPSVFWEMTGKEANTLRLNCHADEKIFVYNLYEIEQ